MIMNAQKGQEVDHRDHNTLDNRRENIRICTHAENMMNRQKGSGSKPKGVSEFKRTEKLRARIKVKGKDIHLGYFDNEDDAALAYNVAALKYHGEFACLNIIE